MRYFITKRKNSTLDQIVFLAAGTLIGAGLALLLAPQTGRETRRSLLRLGAVAKRGARHFQSDLNRKMDHLLIDMRSDLKSCLDDGRVWTKEKRSEIEEALKAGKQSIEKEVARILHS